MQLQPAVQKEVRHIALGTFGCCVVLVAAFGVGHLAAPLKIPFDYTVVLGAAAGGAVAVLNFLWLGLTVQKVTAESDTKRAQLLMQNARTKRLLVQILWCIAALKIPIFFWVAGVLPLLFPRITILIMQILGLYKPDSENSTEKGGDT